MGNTLDTGIKRCWPYNGTKPGVRCCILTRLQPEGYMLQALAVLPLRKFRHIKRALLTRYYIAVATRIEIGVSAVKQ